MAIIALALSLAGPRIGAGIGRLELQQAERIVRTFVKQAKLEAQRTDQGYYVVLDQDRHSVVLVDSSLKVQRQETMPSSVRFVFDPPAPVNALYVVPSGLVRGLPVKLQGRTTQIEVPLG